MNLIVPDELKNIKVEVPKKERVVSRRCACGKMFVPYRSYQRYCCEAHRIKYGGGVKSYYVKKEAVEKVCAECSMSFLSNDSKRFYCSKQCYDKAQEKRHVIPEVRYCLICDKEFTTAHWSKRYCSEECRRKSHAIKIS